MSKTVESGGSGANIVHENIVFKAQSVHSPTAFDDVKRELEFQNIETEKRTAELSVAIKELTFQVAEKEKRATELIAANKELLQQSHKNQKLAAELLGANQMLQFQNSEKEKLTTELLIANKTLLYENGEKEKRAAELVLANEELAIQNKEKEKRAAELIIANRKLAFENIQKEKRTAEKAVRAAELVITNRELAFQENRGIALLLANNELKLAQEELGAFSYSVSHDLRAPIRAINGYAQILLEDHSSNIDSEGHKILNAVIDNSKKMGLLIDDLLSFSKLGRKQVSSTDIDMNELVKSVISDFPVERGTEQPTFEMDALACAYGDPALIKQVWINLISNAIKYSKYRSKIRIGITGVADQTSVIYCVEDWGAGFDMAYYDKLFGVFQRLHSQEEFDGTGIGLAIVQKIVSRHQGRVWAESNIDQGSRFYFSLPHNNCKNI